MLKRFALILATVVAGLLGAVAVTSPAQAAPVDCPTAQICFWIHTDYAGSYVNYAPDVLGFNTCVNFPAAFNNQISSWVSKNSTYGARLYKDGNCGGIQVDQGGPWAAHIYNWWTWGCNDCASSWRVITGPAG